MLNNQPLVSVIVPVYKVEAYLDDCVKSIVEQTYNNLEIILVDDGSPDNCPKMCDEWAKRDTRIKVIHKQNGGLSDARNAGLDIATGDYITFVDSDDLVDVCMIDIMARKAEENHVDIVECNFIKFSDESPKHKGNESHQDDLYETKSALEQLINENAFHYTVWNKIYRKHIFDDLQFEVGKLHEDVFFTYQAFGKSKTVLKISEYLYFYRQRADSIMGTAFSIKTLDSLDARRQQLEYMRKEYPELEGVAQAQLLGSCMYFSQLALLSEDKKLQEIALEKAECIFRQERKNMKYSARRKQKMWLNIASISFVGCCKLRNRLKRGL